MRPVQPRAAVPTILLVCGLLAVLPACRGPATETAPTGFPGWVSDHAVAIESYDRPLSAVAVETLRSTVGPARVVGLGESRHDTREQTLVKGLLVRHLVEDLGFRAVILEESFPHAATLDRYVTTGEGDLREHLNGLAGWYLWDTEEMLGVVEWIRQYNERRAADDPVRIFGMDVTAPASAVASVLEALEVAGVDGRLDARSLGLDLLEGDFWATTWERYAGLSEDRRAELAASYDALVETVQAEKERLVAGSSEHDYERTRWLAEIGRAGNAMFSAAGREQGGAVRERAMARTVTWILDREIVGERAILWAHNLHVAKSTFRMPDQMEGELEPMAVRLSEELGDDYVAIGAAFGEGVYGPDLPPGERVFEVPSANVMDGALARVGLPSFLVDLRAAAGDPEAGPWLKQDREWVAQDARSVLVPVEAFDLVYFVSEISRSQPTPLALARYREMRD